MNAVEDFFFSDLIENFVKRFCFEFIEFIIFSFGDLIPKQITIIFKIHYKLIIRNYYVF